MRVRTPLDLGLAIRDRRRSLRLGQADLAARIGVSRKWIVEAEKGKLRAEIGLLMRTLAALGLGLSVEEDRPIVPDAGIDVDGILDRLRDQAG